MSLLGQGAGRGFARSTFLPQSLGGAVDLVDAPVLPQLFLTDSVPSNPFLVCAGLPHFLAGTVCVFAVARGISPLGAGDGAGVDTTACRVGCSLGLAVSILRELSKSRFTGSSFLDLSRKGLPRS